MEIVVKERSMLDQFRCRDVYKTVKVLGLAFKQGDLFYFKKNRFEYVVVSYNEKENVYEL